MNMRLAKMQELQERRVADNAGTSVSTPGLGSTSNTITSSGNSVSSGPSSGMSREWSDSTKMLCGEMWLELISLESENLLAR